MINNTITEYFIEQTMVVLWYQSSTFEGCLTLAGQLQEMEIDYRHRREFTAANTVKFCGNIALIKSELFKN